MTPIADATMTSAMLNPLLFNGFKKIIQLPSPIVLKFINGLFALKGILLT